MDQKTRSRTTRRNSVDCDFVLIAIAYAEEAIGDKKRKKFGKWIRLAAKRFLSDLKHAQKKRPRFNWSPEKANHACATIEKLPHVEGSWNPENLIRLEPAQIFFICQLFGFRRHDGSRRFTNVLFAVARKNAKSTIAAAILLYCFCYEPEEGPQIISAATTGDQARIVWGVAKRMVDKCEALREAKSLEAFAHSIVRYSNGGSFKPINAKASTQDGLNPSALSFDELHAHKTHDLYNVLRSAAGSRKNPLFLYTTTEGYENPGPWAEERKFAQQLLEGLFQADHYLAIYYALDEDDDDFDESKWIKANPLLNVSISMDILRESAKEAKQKPGSLAEFRIKRLNRQAASASGCINLRKWRRCGGEIDLKMLEGMPCWGSIDLASTTDMNSWRLLWLLDNLWITWGRYWVPEDAVRQRTERGSTPYASWVQSGFIQQTRGDVTDYEIVKREIMEDCTRFGPKEVAYDPWNATQFSNDLVNEGLPLIPFVQGPKSYQPGWQAFEMAYTAKKLRHDDNPVLNWNCANLVGRYDANNNFAPDRRRSTEKIDGVVTLLMCFGRAALEAENIFDFKELTLA